MNKYLIVPVSVHGATHTRGEETVRVVELPATAVTMGAQPIQCESLAALELAEGLAPYVPPVRKRPTQGMPPLPI